MPQFAADEHFLDMYRFIIDVGCYDAPFVKDLMAFHQQFVGPKIRCLRLNVFATMTEFGLKFPHLKIAGLKHANSCDAKRVQNGFCEPVTVKTVKDAVAKDGKVCQQAEDILRWFHVDCSRQNKDSTRGCGVTMDFSKVFGVWTERFLVPSRGVAATINWRRWSRQGTKLTLSWRRLLPRAALLSARTHSRPATVHPRAWRWTLPAAAPAQSIWHPKSFSTAAVWPSRPRMRLTKRNVRESLPWRNFMETSELQQSFAEDANKAAAWLAIHRLHTSLPTRDGLAILRGGEPKGFRVAAEVALKAGAMILSPLVQGSNRIVSRTTQPWALPVTGECPRASTFNLYRCLARIGPSTF